MKTTPSVSPTTTDGCPSSERASLILTAARESGAKNWRHSLSREQLAVVDDVRAQWLASREASGVSAVHMARTIIAQMPECKFPRPKQLAQWLIAQQ
jgi:hypothetical protein